MAIETPNNWRGVRIQLEEASPMWTHKLYKSILIMSCGAYLVMFILDASVKAGFRPKLQIFKP